MRSPRDMEIVQIDITNVCDHSCSNCTRFREHHRKPYLMDFDMFRKAVGSMDGFKHCLGVMGGEPTLHPRFADFCDFMRDAFPQSRPTNVFTGPDPDFIGYINKANLRLKRDAIRGLFSSLGTGYYRHFEKIQDTFGYQCLNDHMNPSSHGGLMITRRELGIPDDEWITLRDNCWLQNLWSASITPKGAFFCEIAGSLDMLLNGPGGWPVEKGWWEREPKDFADQLHWCELCSAALAVPKRDARDEVDDVSPEWLKRLEAIGSPKLKRGKVAVMDVADYRAGDHQITTDLRPYLAEDGMRMSRENRIIYPHPLLAVIRFDKDASDGEVVRVLRESGEVSAAISNNPGHGAVVAGMRAEFIGGESEAMATLSVECEKDRGNWVLLSDGGAVPEGLTSALEDLVFNVGCLYVDAAAGLCMFNTRAMALSGWDDVRDLKSRYPAGKIVETTLDRREMP